MDEEERGEEGDERSENVVSESRRKRRGEILRDCESKDKRCGRVREKRRRGMREGWGYEVSTYATLRDDGNRESREVGFRTVSDAYDSKGYSNNTNASSETTAAAAEEEDEEDLNSPEAKKRRKSVAAKVMAESIGIPDKQAIFMRGV